MNQSFPRRAFGKAALAASAVPFVGMDLAKGDSWSAKVQVEIVHSDPADDGYWPITADMRGTICRLIHQQAKVGDLIYNYPFTGEEFNSVAAGDCTYQYYATDVHTLVLKALDRNYTFERGLQGPHGGEESMIDVVRPTLIVARVLRVAPVSNWLKNMQAAELDVLYASVHSYGRLYAADGSREWLCRTELDRLNMFTNYVPRRERVPHEMASYIGEHVRFPLEHSWPRMESHNGNQSPCQLVRPLVRVNHIITHNPEGNHAVAVSVRGLNGGGSGSTA